MLKMNKKMKEKIKNTSKNEISLHPELLTILDSGYLKKDGCIFLSALANRKSNAKKSDFPDKTGYECFINSIHTDDFSPSAHLAQAIIFAEKIFEKWRDEKEKNILQAIISNEEFGTVIKLHIQRAGESWIDEDLDSYEESILIADSTRISLP